MKIENVLVDAILKTDFKTLPEKVVEATKKSIIDTIAVTLGGRKAEGCEAIVQMVKEWGGKKEATILSHGFQAPFPNASFVNGVMARALDLDEVHDIGTVHTSASIVPATLAAAEAIGGISGKEFIAANALGIDLICRMSLTSTIGACISGMAGSYQGGTFGCAAAVGKLLRLDDVQTLNALGIAYSQASGNTQCYVDGALTVRVQQGLSAKAGAMSALLAQRGITGGGNFLEGKFGYLNVYYGGKYDRNILLNDIGKHFEGINVSQKPLYPCCKFTHTYIDAAKAIVSEEKIPPDSIHQVNAEVNSQEVFNLVCDPIDVKQKPRTIVDAQFSLPYTIALALVKGNVSLHDFTLEAIKDNNVLRMAHKVRVTLKTVEGQAILPTPGIIEVETHRNGQKFANRVDYVKGHPKNPNSLEDCIEKMRACIDYGEFKISRNKLEQLRDLLLNLERVKDMRQLITLLK